MLQRLHDRCHILSVHSHFTHRKFCTHAVFLRSLIPQERLSDTRPPIFDVCEIDLDMRMSFQNVAPCEVTIYQSVQKQERNLKKLSQSFVPKCSNTEERKLKKLSQSFVPKCSDKEETNLQEAVRVFCTKVFTYRGKESPRSCYSLLHQSVQT